MVTDNIKKARKVPYDTSILHSGSETGVTRESV